MVQYTKCTFEYHFPNEIDPNGALQFRILITLLDQSKKNHKKARKSPKGGAKNQIQIVDYFET